ncbi:MAG: hypothetical protein IH825_08055, partial [Candidatus Marinimicrobia bacterium]|nr:hypothetical protein [Candidatus Neomarinimicrobiota bacterium]
MRRFGIFIWGILAFTLLATPAMAVTDTVDVTISVPALSTFNAGGDVTLTATATDLDNTFVFAADASTMTLQDNTASWTLEAEIDTAYTDYSLYIEDTQASGNASGTGFHLIPVNPSTVALTSFAGYGTTGDFTYTLD